MNTTPAPSQDEMICFVNNFLITQGFEFPYSSNNLNLPDSNDSFNKNTSIVCSLTHRLIQSQLSIEDLESRLRRLSEECKEVNTNNSKQKTRIDQLEKEVLNSEITLKLERESNQRLQIELSNSTQELARFRSQTANKEKTLTVDLRKKERELEKLKEQITAMLKNGFKHLGVAPFAVSPAPKPQSYTEKPNGKEVNIWKEMHEKLEERSNSNIHAFENLKGILGNTYFALCDTCSQQPIDLLSSVQLNSFDDAQSKVIVDSIAKLFEVWALQKNELTSPAVSQQLAAEQSKFHALLTEKDTEIETHKRLLRLAMTNESINLQTERREIQMQKAEIEERAARLEEDRKKLVEMTLKFAQEKQAFLKEKLPANKVV
jgi:hypothetical protein